MTYRLGLFGFLGSDEARPANLGLPLLPLLARLRAEGLLTF